MNNKMITIPYADAIEYGENTSALFKACLLYTSQRANAAARISAA